MGTRYVHGKCIEQLCHNMELVSKDIYIYVYIYMCREKIRRIVGESPRWYLAAVWATCLLCMSSVVGYSQQSANKIL